VGEIADRMDVSRPAVSQHLKILKAAHLVTDRAEGTRRLYALDQRGINSLRSWLDGVWDEALIGFKEAAEQEAAKGTTTMKRRKRRNHELRADDVPQNRRQ
jgi:DNA-binding transcriptional ArsR family regulator